MQFIMVIMLEMDTFVFVHKERINEPTSVLLQTWDVNDSLHHLLIQEVSHAVASRLFLWMLVLTKYSVINIKDSHIVDS